MVYYDRVPPPPRRSRSSVVVGVARGTLVTDGRNAVFTEENGLDRAARFAGTSMFALFMALVAARVTKELTTP